MNPKSPVSGGRPTFWANSLACSSPRGIWFSCAGLCSAQCHMGCCQPYFIQHRDQVLGANCSALGLHMNLDAHKLLFWLPLSTRPILQEPKSTEGQRCSVLLALNRTWSCNPLTLVGTQVSQHPPSFLSSHAHSAEALAALMWLRALGWA